MIPRARPTVGSRSVTGLAALVAVACTGTPLAALQAVDESPEAVVARVLASTPLIDGHNDLPWAIRGSDGAPFAVEAAANDLRSATPFQTDLERLRAGGVGGQFWSVYIPYGAIEDGAAKTQLEQIDIALRIMEEYPDVLELALSASDVDRIFGSGKVASMLGMEGGHAIENSLGALRAYYAMGIRYMTLTHNGTLDWADAGSDERLHGGLTDFGKEVVREMNRLGMLVDLSHTSPETMNDALDVAEAPVIWSHAGARGVFDHSRNVPDQVLRRVSENGGVVMAIFYPPFLSDDEATLSDVADHVDHIAAVAGVDHVGIGSDFDGMGGQAPVGLEDVSRFPALLEELARRGWSESDLRKLAGENVLRVWREAETVSRRLRRERDPSTATIEELDGVPVSTR